MERLNGYDDIVSADVIGTEGYEVEIYLDNGNITDMYCSCPYAATDRNCKHMAAVLYKWSETQEKDNVLVKNSGTDGCTNEISTNSSITA